MRSWPRRATSAPPAASCDRAARYGRTTACHSRGRAEAVRRRGARTAWRRRWCRAGRSGNCRSCREIPARTARADRVRRSRPRPRSRARHSAGNAWRRGSISNTVKPSRQRLAGEQAAEQADCERHRIVVAEDGDTAAFQRAGAIHQRRAAHRGFRRARRLVERDVGRGCRVEIRLHVRGRLPRALARVAPAPSRESHA